MVEAVGVVGVTDGDGFGGRRGRSGHRREGAEGSAGAQLSTVHKHQRQPKRECILSLNQLSCVITQSMVIIALAMPPIRAYNNLFRTPPQTPVKKILVPY